MEAGIEAPTHTEPRTQPTVPEGENGRTSREGTVVQGKSNRTPWEGMPYLEGKNTVLRGYVRFNPLEGVELHAPIAKEIVPPTVEQV